MLRKLCWQDHVFCWTVFWLAHLCARLILPTLPVSPPIAVDLPPVMVLCTALMLCLFAPIVEEVLFRWLTFRILQGFRTSVQIIGSAVLFALAHVQPERMIPALALGLVLGLVYSRSANLTHCILLHLTTNLVDGLLLSMFPIPTLCLLCAGNLLLICQRSDA